MKCLVTGINKSSQSWYNLSAIWCTSKQHQWLTHERSREIMKKKNYNNYKSQKQQSSCYNVCTTGQSCSLVARSVIHNSYPISVQF